LSKNTKYIVETVENLFLSFLLKNKNRHRHIQYQIMHMQRHEKHEQKHMKSIVLKY